MTNSEITVAAGKFHRLLDYLEQIGLAQREVAGRANLSAQAILKLEPVHPLPAVQYARLYREAVAQMQEFNHPIPWAAGLGSESFELMSRCMISGRTLREALDIASRFDRLLHPIHGDGVTLLDLGAATAKLGYRISLPEGDSTFAPPHWDRASYQATVAHASGLEVWSAFCGWLTGQPLELVNVNIAAPFVSGAYARALDDVFRCPVEYDCAENMLEFNADSLDRRLVQTADSLSEFLEYSVYHLIASERQQSSTSAAIKSLVAIDLNRGLPTFNSVARSMHMSESSLRRRLQRENTSYQALKDEVRCEVAIDQLLNHDAKVADVSFHLGFTEPSSFVRSFKNWTGRTPSEYREEMLATSAV